MCGDIRPIIQCGPSLSERIEKDIKELTEKTGVDFDQFTDFMWKNPYYAVVWYPDLIKASNGRMFNCYLEASYKSHVVFIINSQTKEVAACDRHIVKDAVDSWFIEKEKEQCREQLRSVGIEPNW